MEDQQQQQQEETFSSLLLQQQEQLEERELLQQLQQQQQQQQGSTAGSAALTPAASPRQATAAAAAAAAAAATAAAPSSPRQITAATAAAALSPRQQIAAAAATAAATSPRQISAAAAAATAAATSPRQITAAAAAGGGLSPRAAASPRQITVTAAALGEDEDPEESAAAEAAAAAAADLLLEARPLPPSTEEQVSSLLDSLCEKGSLTVHKCLLLKQRYFKLQERYLHALKTEELAAKRLQRLSLLLQQQQEELTEAAARAAVHAQLIVSLKQELAEKKNDIIRSSSRLQMLQQQFAAVTAEAAELEGQLAAQKRRAEEVEVVLIKGTKDTIEMLKKEEKRLTMAIERGTHDQARLKQRERILNGKVEDILTRKESLSKELLEIDIKPQRQTEQRELTEHMLDALQQQNACIEQQMQEQQQVINHLDTQIQALTRQLQQQQQKLKEQRRISEELEPQQRDIRNRLDLAQLEYADGTERRSTMQTEIKEAIKTLHDAKEELMHFKTALEKAKMDYKKGTAQRDAAAALLPPFVARKGEMATERRMLLKEAEERAKQAAALRAENENLDSYIKGDEATLKEKNDELLALKKRREELEKESKYIINKLGFINSRKITLSIQRQQMANNCQESTIINKQIKQQIQLKEIEGSFAIRRIEELRNKEEKIKKEIDKIRQQCDEYARKGEEKRQNLLEIIKRYKILTNEIEIYQQDNLQKDNAIQAIAMQCLKGLQQRAVLRTQHSRLLQKISICNAEVEQCMIVSDRLNICLCDLEEKMKKQKEIFEVAVESRNVTGIQLIDRNDEICLMWERSNALQYAEVQGQRVTQEAEAEVRQLRLKAKELQQLLQQQKKRCRELPQLAEEAAELKEQLAKERLNVKRLRLDLEDPQGNREWREVGMEEPKIEELQIREEKLQKKLKKQKRKLIDLDLRLEEINEETEEIKEKIRPKKEVAAALLQQLNLLQQQIENVSSKRRCLKAETDTYKVMLPQLTTMQQQLAEQLAAARANVLQGQPPSAAAAAELQQQQQRRQRRRQIQQSEAERRRQEKEKLDNKTTTAPQRPCLYTPEGGEEFLPKPYGAFKPFLPKPSHIHHKP